MQNNIQFIYSYLYPSFLISTSQVRTTKELNIIPRISLKEIHAIDYDMNSIILPTQEMCGVQLEIVITPVCCFCGFVGEKLNRCAVVRSRQPFLDKTGLFLSCGS